MMDGLELALDLIANEQIFKYKGREERLPYNATGAEIKEALARLDNNEQ